MSSYRDRYRSRLLGSAPGSFGPGEVEVGLTHSWALDARQRLAFLYGDPDAREALNAPDVALWRGLGQ